METKTERQYDYLAILFADALVWESGGRQWSPGLPAMAEDTCREWGLHNAVYVLAYAHGHLEAAFCG